MTVHVKAAFSLSESHLCLGRPSGIPNSILGKELMDSPKFVLMPAVNAPRNTPISCFNYPFSVSVKAILKFTYSMLLYFSDLAISRVLVPEGNSGLKFLAES